MRCLPFCQHTFFFGIVYLVAVRRSRIPTLILVVLFTGSSYPCLFTTLYPELRTQKPPLGLHDLFFLETIAIGLFIRS